jgi:hypothetical protein
MKRRSFIRYMVTLSVATGTTTLTGLALARGRGGGRGRRSPASPRSVGGVRRRTRRRTRRRIRRHQRLYALPYGCTTTRYRGSISYYYCAGIWYRPAYEGTTVIYIVEEIEPGAETNVEFEE